MIALHFESTEVGDHRDARFYYYMTARGARAPLTLTIYLSFFSLSCIFCPLTKERHVVVLLYHGTFCPSPHKTTGTNLELLAD